VTTFDPAIKPDLEEEARISARYTEMLASAKLQFAGQTVNLAGLGPYAEDPDRSYDTMRNGAVVVFRRNAAELDAIYDQLVKLRHACAEACFKTYTPLGYRRLRRVDYGRTTLPGIGAGGSARRASCGRLLEARRSRTAGTAAVLDEP